MNNAYDVPEECRRGRENNSLTLLLQTGYLTICS